MSSQALHPAVESAHIDDSIFEMRPDYRALLIAATGVHGGPSDEFSDEALTRAERKIRTRLGEGAPETLPEIAAWRETFLSFGVKPRQGRSSVEALVRRIDVGIPRIDRLTDLYNAVSVEHLLPIGGENLESYLGAAHLALADGSEAFDTVADGETVVVNPEAGEVIWRDDVGVTCRRWNWRQCVRTRLDQDTTSALFILDALEPISAEALEGAADHLISLISVDAPNLLISRRLLSAR